MSKISKLIEPECHLWGTEFSPKELHKIDNIEFRGQNELGEILTRGRYKNKAAPYGSCELLTPSYVDLSDRIFWMAEFILLHKDKFEKAGASDITFWIYWSGVQGGMAFTPKELKMISKTNVPMCIDYSYIEGDKI